MHENRRGRPLRWPAAGILLAAASITARSEPRPIDGRSAAVLVVADGCPEVDLHGGGTLVTGDRVVTSAHVVAGSTAVEVWRGAIHERARVVALDPSADLAVLAVTPIFAGTAPLGTVAGPVERGIVVVVRDGRPMAIPVVVKRAILLTTEDIYLGATVDRDAFEIEADIEPGDSGAAVLVGGRTVAVVFARNRHVQNLAYALDPGPIRGALGNTETISTGHCSLVG